MITLEIKDKSPILYRGQRFRLLVGLELEGVAVVPAEIKISLVSLSGNDILVSALTMADSGRSDYDTGKVDCIFPGASTIGISYQGDAILQIQVVGGDTYRQTVRVV